MVVILQLNSIFSGNQYECEPVDKHSLGSIEPSTSESTQLSQAGVDNIDTVPVSETNLPAAGCKRSKKLSKWGPEIQETDTIPVLQTNLMPASCKQSQKFSRWGPDIQETEDHHGTAQDTNYRGTTSKLQSGHLVPVTVVYGKHKASQHQQREV